MRERNGLSQGLEEVQRSDYSEKLQTIHMMATVTQCRILLSFFDFPKLNHDTGF
jgi:hypothetical protein